MIREVMQLNHAIFVLEGFMMLKIDLTGKLAVVHYNSNEKKQQNLWKKSVLKAEGLLPLRQT